MRTHDATRTAGFTLLELLVVLILMALAAGFVAPALIVPAEADRAPLIALLQTTRETAVQRGETLRLGIGSSGRWRLDGTSALEVEPIATGVLPNYDGPPATLVVSPLGMCAFDVLSDRAFQNISLDPLTCTVQRP